jgi:uncharacterized membrane protein YwaF
MTWGFMSTAHLISLVVAVVIVILFSIIVSKLNKKIQTLVLFIFSLSGIAAITFNLVTWGSPLEYLPLHMCSINALLLPFAVLTKNRTLCNLLVVWCLGALVALVLNQSVMETTIMSKVFIFYYFPHIFEFIIPILLLVLKHSKLDYRCILSSVVITMVIYTGIHFANVYINNYCIENNILDNAGNVVQVNYMFSIEPSNPVLNIFYNIIPYSYWYMYLCVPIVVVYLLVIYLEQIIFEIKRNYYSKI